ncbi:MAG: Uma2 family endonuclease [Jaaginema sp. PMC 1079.18]|nr:Uma2 family endonuclease [Jaaginema sp. PMC 1080.18]MEC4853324.1 Uma2 family endonuclease [Jaaginema sp. PMC 1079.18]MEC4868991.1 Uma2 family endonuclease [Jaaginema sp. PMC 1078.18]
MTVALNQLDTPILVDAMTWREFKAVAQLLERPGMRLSFLNGILEIRRMPGEQHERIKERVGALLELYLLQIGIDYTPTGSMTLESESGLVKREADKSYKLAPNRSQPDLVIEIVVTSGGINKLEAYRRLGISEVWFWEDGRLDLYCLRSEDGEAVYDRVSVSQLLQGLDIDVFLACVNLENHVEAIRTFQRSLQA